MMVRYLSALLFVVGVFLPVSNSGSARDYIMATAGIGGTYYPVGSAIATLVKLRLEGAHDISMTAVTTVG